MKGLILALGLFPTPAFAQAPIWTKTGTVYLEGGASPVQLYQREFAAFATLGVHLERDWSVHLKGTVRQSTKAAGLDENSRGAEVRYSPYPLPLYVELGGSQLFAKDHDENDATECVKYTAQGPSFGAGVTKQKSEGFRYGLSFFNAVVPRKERTEPCGSGTDFYKGYSHTVVVTSYLSLTLGLLF